MGAGNALRRELPAVARFVHRLRGRRCAGAVFDAGEGDSGLSVHYRTTRPDPAAMQPQALTQPFHLIALPRSDDPVTFVAESPSR
jgi:hypothetical protein